MAGPEEVRNRITRRQALKRVGTAGAIAWAMPVITSLNQKAFAASLPPQACDHPGQLCGAANLCQCMFSGPCLSGGRVLACITFASPQFGTFDGDCATCPSGTVWTGVFGPTFPPSLFPSVVCYALCS